VVEPDQKPEQPRGGRAVQEGHPHHLGQRIFATQPRRLVPESPWP